MKQLIRSMVFVLTIATVGTVCAQIDANAAKAVNVPQPTVVKVVPTGFGPYPINGSRWFGVDAHFDGGEHTSMMYFKSAAIAKSELDAWLAIFKANGIRTENPRVYMDVGTYKFSFKALGGQKSVDTFWSQSEFTPAMLEAMRRYGLKAVSHRQDVEGRGFHISYVKEKGKMSLGAYRIHDESVMPRIHEIAQAFTKAGFVVLNVGYFVNYIGYPDRMKDKNSHLPTPTSEKTYNALRSAKARLAGKAMIIDSGAYAALGGPGVDSYYIDYIENR